MVRRALYDWALKGKPAIIFLFPYSFIQQRLDGAYSMPSLVLDAQNTKKNQACSMTLYSGSALAGNVCWRISTRTGGSQLKGRGDALTRQNKLMVMGWGWGEGAAGASQWRTLVLEVKDTEPFHMAKGIPGRSNSTH
jgi:hypothetical protein